jgi:hypothetical protein
MPIFSLLCSLINKQLTEQLKVYYSSWQIRLNVRESMSITSTVRRPITKAARDLSRAKDAPTLPLRPLAAPSITRGFAISNTSSVSTLDRLGELQESSHSTIAAPSSIAATLAQERVAPAIASTTVQSLQSKVRNPRTCMKCGRDSDQCLGHANRKLCSHPCQDCGEMSCKRRNAKWPKRTCKDGWEPIAPLSGHFPGSEHFS